MSSRVHVIPQRRALQRAFHRRGPLGKRSPHHWPGSCSYPFGESIRTLGKDAALTIGLPVTIRGWLQAYREGARPRRLLGECSRNARYASPAATWIYLASDLEIDRQC